MDQLQLTEASNKTNVTIQVLGRKTRNLLSSLLNPEKVIPTEKGLPRCWRGLAELCGISGERIPSIQCHSDPTTEVLKHWHQNNQKNCTIYNLLRFLEDLDRFDIIDDITELIDEDLLSYENREANGVVDPLDLSADKYILTTDDVSRLQEGLELQHYDAFVLFADDDIDFATQVIEVMEKEYNMKFCVKDRDLVGGGFEHDSIIKLISERCARLIVIVSTEFLNSSANKFFYSFAQAIGIEQRQRKIIPCIYKQCEKLPPELTCYFMLDYRRSGKLCNFWDRLHSSIRAPKLKENNKQPVNRSVSHYTTQSSKLESSDLDKTNGLRPINQVKFSSMVNLDSLDPDKIILDHNMMPSTSANSLGGCTETVKKSRLKWLKKFLLRSNHDVKSATTKPESKPSKKHRFSVKRKQLAEAT